MKDSFLLVVGGIILFLMIRKPETISPGGASPGDASASRAVRDIANAHPEWGITPIQLASFLEMHFPESQAALQGLLDADPVMLFRLSQFKLERPGSEYMPE